MHIASRHHAWLPLPQDKPGAGAVSGGRGVQANDSAQAPRVLKDQIPHAHRKAGAYVLRQMLGRPTYRRMVLLCEGACPNFHWSTIQVQMSLDRAVLMSGDPLKVKLSASIPSRELNGVKVHVVQDVQVTRYGAFIHPPNTFAITYSRYCSLVRRSALSATLSR